MRAMSMSIAKIEAELSAVAANVSRLEAELAKAQEWKTELTISLKVMRKISSRSADTKTSAHTADDEPASPQSQRETQPPSANTTVAWKARPKTRGRSPAVVQAEAALVEMLTKAGTYIRQIDAVNRLRTEYGIVVGTGVPGRETSDLSASLGAGKSQLLRVTRQHGWELVAWNGSFPPNSGGFLTTKPTNGEEDSVGS